MKKYLFDKIAMCDSVKFIPYRKATMGESFMANTQGTFNQKEWTFKPYSLKDFLNMLSKTKLNDNNEYDIVVWLNINHSEPIGFDLLLKNFVSDVYKNKKPNEKIIAKFYQKAYQIREQAKKDKELLNKEPQEFIK